ncbi:MAG TPA: hypothetical protein VE978_07700 [Chitinophagales bacterium]|nr:hypothetical protein [Chitinophagales bacterium]
MKKILLTAFISLLMIQSTEAQWVGGGFGNFVTGPVYNISSELRKELQSPQLLGSDLQLNSPAIVFGGAGYSVRPRKIILGGSGYWYIVSSSTNEGEVKFESRAGFFNMGYRVIRKKNWFAFPYWGMGVSAMKFKITNQNPDKIFIFDTDSVRSNQNATYTTGGLGFEMGFAVKYLAFNTEEKNKHDKITGLVLGADGGIAVLPAFAKWHSNLSDSNISSLSKPFVISPYVRITLGFGVFYDKK